MKDADQPPQTVTRSVKKLYDVECRLTFEWDRLPQWRNPVGVMLRQLSFDVLMFWNGTSLEWEVRIGGKIQGKGSTNIRSQEDSESTTPTVRSYGSETSLRSSMRQMSLLD